MTLIQMLDSVLKQQCMLSSIELVDAAGPNKSISFFLQVWIIAIYLSIYLAIYLFIYLLEEIRFILITVY